MVLMTYVTSEAFLQQQQLSYIQALWAAIIPFLDPLARLAAPMYSFIDAPAPKVSSW